MENIKDSIKKTVMEQDLCDILMKNCINPELSCEKCVVFKKAFGPKNASI